MSVELRAEIERLGFEKGQLCIAAENLRAAHDKVVSEFQRVDALNRELLAALEELRDADWLALPGRAGDLVEAAIAKAKGGAA